MAFPVQQQLDLSTRLKRIFTQIDCFLPEPAIATATDNSVEYYRDQIAEAKEFVQRLRPIQESDQLPSVEFELVNWQIGRLRKYIASLDRVVEQKLASRVAITTPELSPYDGNILHFLRFWAEYRELVGNNPALSDCVKFRLLRDSLHIHGAILLADFNPLIPKMQLVHQRVEEFFRHEVNVSTMTMQAIAKLPQVTDTNDNLAISEIYIAAKQVKVLFKWARMSEEFYVVAAGRLYHKFGIEVDENSSQLSLDNFLHNCQQMILSLIKREYRESCGQVDLMLDDEEDTDEEMDFMMADRAVVERCAFCYHSHSAEICDVFIVLEERKMWVKQRGLCPRCLSKANQQHQCDIECLYCRSEEHNLALCPQITLKQRDDNEEEEEYDEEELVSEPDSDQTMSLVGDEDGNDYEGNNGDYNDYPEI